MQISKRQKEILNGVIKEYIDSAQPVSSQLFKKRYGFGISPATIRSEMQALTQKGYLSQPHTSAGRIPADKGYRFFVDRLFSLNNDELDKDFIEKFQEMKKEIEDDLRFIQLLTKNLASASSNLAVSYFLEREFFWKEGWQELFQEPEFRDFAFNLRFVRMVDNLEKEIKEFISDNFLTPKIYIGKENPISRSEDFSMIISRCSFPENQKGVLMILGPKRMSYQRNISLINSVVKFLEEH